MPKKMNRVQVTILNGASLSDIGDLGQSIGGGNAELVGIEMPAAWTAANLTLQNSSDGGSTFNNVYDSAGTELTITAAAARYIDLTPTTFAGLGKVKVRSGTSGTPVNQAADRIVILVFREAA